MEEFTIFCTEGQTKKAIELGAPVKATFLEIPNMFEYKGCPIEIPTAGQMLGWLRSKGLRFKIAEYADATYWKYHNEYSYKCGSESCYKDAVSSLIDASLDYLTNNK